MINIVNNYMIWSTEAGSNDEESSVENDWYQKIYSFKVMIAWVIILSLLSEKPGLEEQSPDKFKALHPLYTHILPNQQTVHPK